MINYETDVMPRSTLEEFYRFFQQYQPRIEIWVNFRIVDFEYKDEAGNIRSGPQAYLTMADDNPSRFTRFNTLITPVEMMERRGNAHDFTIIREDHEDGSYVESVLALSGADTLVLREETPTIEQGRIDLDIKELPPIEMKIAGIAKYLVFDFGANGYIILTCSGDPAAELPISNLSEFEVLTVEDVLAFPSMYFYHEAIN